MKKFTAILLSFVIISCVSGLAIQAETEESYFTPEGITVGNTISSIPTWMTFNVTYGDKATDGYIAKINSNYNTSASSGNIYIKLPSSIWDTPVSKLAFSFKCTDGTWGTRGGYVYLAPSISNFSSKGIAIKNWFSFNENGTTLTIDLSLDTYANAVSGKYCYLILGNGGVPNYYTGTEMLLTDVLVYGGEKDGTTTNAISTDTKASIRLNDQAGIRFYTNFDKSQIEGTVVEKGTLIGPKDLVGDYLTIEDKEAGNAVAVPYLADTLWAGNEFVGSIVGIQEKNYNRTFTARAYVKLSDGTYLYSATTTTKTVAEIADDYIADANSGYADLDEETKNLVDAWATAND